MKEIEKSQIILPIKIEYNIISKMTKEQFIFLIETQKPFEFTYMPARFFTLYAKWGFDSIKGKTFKHTSSVLTWSGTEEEKKVFLGEIG